MDDTRLKRWEHVTEWPLMAAAVLFFVAYAVQILQPDDATIASAAEWVLFVTWVIFAIDYLTRLAIAPRRWHWFRHHLVDLAIVALPMLRPLRLMRFLAIVTFLQRGAGTLLRGKVVIYTAGATILTVIVASLAVLDAERGSTGSEIETFGDSLWWSIVTITTVGYGDYTPITVSGRIIAVGLMMVGLALIGIITATLASWIVEKVGEDTASAATATEAQVNELRAEIAELKRLLGDRPTGT